MIIKKLVLFLLIKLFGQLSATNEIINNADRDELVFAQVLLRHGNRTIIKTYKNDPYKSERFWPGGFFELTTVGKQTEYELGRYLRRRYNELIGPGYSNEKVYIRSVDEDIILMSGECTSAGLFFPIGDQKWVDFINWQPVPIHTVPLKEDYLLCQDLPCPKIDKLYKQILNSKEITGIFEKYSDFNNFFEAHSGSKIKSIIDYIFPYDAINIEHLRGLPLPEFAQKAYDSGLLEYFAALSSQLETATPEMKKVKAGFLIKEIFDRFRNKTLSQLDPNLKLYIYTGDSTSLINTLNSLGLFKELPPFAASIHFELYKCGLEYYVQIFYRKDCSNYLPPLNIPNCGTKCPLKKLYEIYKNILPTANETYESLCKL